MAGTNPGFSAANFRTGIRFAMSMGLPPNTEEQATFYFPATSTTVASADVEGVPFDPTAAMTTTRPAPVKVLCAIEWQDASGQQTDFGLIVPSRAVITFLDEEYVQVKDCEYVALRGEKFIRKETAPSIGLFNVGVYQMVFVAEGAM